ncbi:hypothetical protein [Ruminococcus sp.]|uniref:hypothetical protein n=1 Tax=Ruminococcus sp. TaxID=41978 RepID=UPI00399217C2
MEIRKSKPPKHTPELLQKAKAAVQSAFFGNSGRHLCATEKNAAKAFAKVRTGKQTRFVHGA